MGPPRMLRVFVNERALEVPPGTNAHSAVLAFDPALQARLDTQTARITDGRGIPVAHDALLAGGAILRVALTDRPGAAEPPNDVDA